MISHSRHYHDQSVSGSVYLADSTFIVALIFRITLYIILQNMKFIGQLIGVKGIHYSHVYGNKGNI